MGWRMRERGFFPVVLLLLMPSLLPAQDSFTWKELYDRALLENASLAEKNASTAAAQYKWKSARRDRGPELYFESDLSYLTNPRKVDIAQGSLFNGGTLAPGLEFPPLPESDISLPLSGNEWYSFRLVLEQALFTSGKLSAQEKIYRALWESSSLEAEQKKLLIQAEILTIVNSLILLDDILKLIEEQSTAADRFITLIHNAFDSGMTSYSDYLGAQVKTREITLAENQIRKQQKQALLHLEYLCGLEDLIPEQVSGKDLPEPLPTGEKDVLLSQAVANNPILKALNRKIEITRENKKITQGRSYGHPDLGLQVTLDYAGGSLPFTTDEWGLSTNNVTASLGIRTLLGDFGKASADIKEAHNRISEAELGYQDNLNLLKRAIGEEIFNQDLSWETILYYTSKARDDLSVAQQRKEYWQAGYGLEQDYLLQLITWYSDQIYLKQEEINLVSSRYKLMTITGVLPEN